MKAIVVTSVDGTLLVVTRRFTAKKRDAGGTVLIYTPAPGDYVEVKETVEQIASAVGAIGVGGRA